MSQSILDGTQFAIGNHFYPSEPHGRIKRFNFLVHHSPPGTTLGTYNAIAIDVHFKLGGDWNDFAKRSPDETEF